MISAIIRATIPSGPAREMKKSGFVDGTRRELLMSNSKSTNYHSALTRQGCMDSAEADTAISWGPLAFQCVID
jgi:hypothetical protein